MNLKVGDQAPDFRAQNQDEGEESLKNYIGEWVVLYFYPRDFTSGCTKEACSFRDYWAEIKQNAVVLGVSSDSVERHKKFAEKHSLPFPLVADPEKDVIKKYGADGILMPKRVTFVINPEGKIAKIYDKVKAAKHAQEILKDLEEMQKS